MTEREQATPLDYIKCSFQYSVEILKFFEFDEKKIKKKVGGYTNRNLVKITFISFG